MLRYFDAKVKLRWRHSNEDHLSSNTAAAKALLDEIGNASCIKSRGGTNWENLTELFINVKSDFIGVKNMGRAKCFREL